MSWTQWPPPAGMAPTMPGMAMATAPVAGPIMPMQPSAPVAVSTPIAPAAAAYPAAASSLDQWTQMQQQNWQQWAQWQQQYQQWHQQYGEEYQKMAALQQQQQQQLAVPQAQPLPPLPTATTQPPPPPISEPKPPLPPDDPPQHAAMQVKGYNTYTTAPPPLPPATNAASGYTTMAPKAYGIAPPLPPPEEKPVVGPGYGYGYGVGGMMQPGYNTQPPPQQQRPPQQQPPLQQVPPGWSQPPPMQQQQQPPMQQQPPQGWNQQPQNKQQNKSWGNNEQQQQQGNTQNDQGGWDQQGGRNSWGGNQQNQQVGKRRGWTSSPGGDGPPNKGNQRGPTGFGGNNNQAPPSLLSLNIQKPIFGSLGNAPTDFGPTNAQDFGNPIANKNPEAFGGTRPNNDFGQNKPNDGTNSNKRPFQQQNPPFDAKRNKMDVPQHQESPQKQQQQPQQQNWQSSSESGSKTAAAAAAATAVAIDIGKQQEIIDDMTEAERKFMKQFAEWEAQFNKWKDQNQDHPDKDQYRQYEKKWETWRNQLLDRREQMRKKRLAAQMKIQVHHIQTAPASTPTPAQPSTAAPTKPSPAVAAAAAVQPQSASLQPQLPPTQHPPLPSVLQQQVPPDFNRPPPFLNNEPLQFKGKPSAEAIPGQTVPVEQSSSKEMGLLGEDANAGADGPQTQFLNTSTMPPSTGGIPGLDLGDDAGKGHVDVNKLSSETKPGPDFEALSKNINNILGDAKLLSMLSMVSQNKNISPEAEQPPSIVNQLTEEELQQQYEYNQRVLQQQLQWQPASYVDEPPPSLQNNFSAPPQQQTNFRAPPLQQTNFSAPPLQQTNFSVPPLQQNNFSGPPPQRIDFSGPPPNFGQQGPAYNTMENRDNFGGSFNDNRGGFSDNSNKFDNNRVNVNNRDSFNDNRGSFNENRGNFNDRPNFNNENRGNFNFSDKRGGNFNNDNAGNFNNNNRGNFSFSERPPSFSDNNRPPNFINDNFNNNNRGNGNFNSNNNRNKQQEDNFNNRNSFNNRDNFKQNIGESNYGDSNVNSEDFTQDKFDSFESKIQEPPLQPSEEVIPEPEPETEAELWSGKLVDYDHKSLKEPEPEVMIEPLQTFDYRHRAVNRIPYPERPKWLTEILKNFREFDVSVSRPPFMQGPNNFNDNRVGPLHFDKRGSHFDDRGSNNDRRQNFDSRGPNFDKDFDNRGPNFERGPNFDRDNRGATFDHRDKRGPNFDHRDSRSSSFDRRDKRGANFDRGPNNQNFGNRPPNFNESDDFDNQDDLRESFQAINSPDSFDHQRDLEDDAFQGTHTFNTSLQTLPNKRLELSLSQGNKLTTNKPTEEQGKDAPIFDIANPPPPKKDSNVTFIKELLDVPGRIHRPSRIVIILRGPPGSGKTHLAKLIKDTEVEHGNSAPRILSLDDYFMVEQEKEVKEDDGKTVKRKEMVYEYEEGMEESYRQSLFKTFKKTITDGYFPFIIVDNVNEKVKYFGEMWSFAKQNGFQVYVCTVDLDAVQCTRRNTHNRSAADIERIVVGWEKTPAHHPVLDATAYMKSDGSIADVEMEDVDSAVAEEAAVQSAGGGDKKMEVDGGETQLNDDMDDAYRSKWDTFDCSLDNLAKLDGTSKPRRPSSMQAYLKMDTERGHGEDEEFIQPEYVPGGKKRVRWADVEERKQQAKMRLVGFVVGQTDWGRMLDPSQGASALTRTKYIERNSKYKLPHK